VIGSMADLTPRRAVGTCATLPDYYSPANATLAIAGDIDVAKTKRWSEILRVDQRTPKPEAPKLTCR